MIGPTRVRDLIAYAAAVTLITWLALRQWYGDLPRLRWFVPLSLVLLAIAEVLAANQLRTGSAADPARCRWSRSSRPGCWRWRRRARSSVP